MKYFIDNFSVKPADYALFEPPTELSNESIKHPKRFHNRQHHNISSGISAARRNLKDLVEFRKRNPLTAEQKEAINLSRHGDIFKHTNEVLLTNMKLLVQWESFLNKNENYHQETGFIPRITTDKFTDYCKLLDTIVAVIRSEIENSYRLHYTVNEIQEMGRQQEMKENQHQEPDKKPAGLRSQYVHQNPFLRPNFGFTFRRGASGVMPQPLYPFVLGASLLPIVREEPPLEPAAAGPAAGSAAAGEYDELSELPVINEEHPEAAAAGPAAREKPLVAAANSPEQTPLQRATNSLETIAAASRSAAGKSDELSDSEFDVVAPAPPVSSATSRPASVAGSEVEVTADMLAADLAHPDDDAQVRTEQDFASSIQAALARTHSPKPQQATQTPELQAVQVASPQTAQQEVTGGWGFGIFTGLVNSLWTRSAQPAAQPVPTEATATAAGSAAVEPLRAHTPPLRTDWADREAGRRSPSQRTAAAGFVGQEEVRKEKAQGEQAGKQ